MNDDYGAAGCRLWVEKAEFWNLDRRARWKLRAFACPWPMTERPTVRPTSAAMRPRPRALALLLEQRGDLAGAEAAFRRADERGDANGAFEPGAILERRGELAAAESAYQRPRIATTGSWPPRPARLGSKSTAVPSARLRRVSRYCADPTRVANEECQFRATDNCPG